MKLDRQLINERVALMQRHCKERGFSLTYQREVIYRVLAASGSHPTPEAIYSQVCRKIPSISLATVYKNIKFFLDLGLLKEVTALHERQLLDSDLEPHHHFVCQRCKTVIDICELDLEPVRWKVNPPSGIQIDGYKVEVTGLCTRCTSKHLPFKSPNRRRKNGSKTKRQQNA